MYNATERRKERYHTVPEYREKRLSQKGPKPSIEKQREYAVRWRAKNPDKVRAKSRNWAARHPQEKKVAGRKAYLKQKFGITLEQYDEMLKRQGGTCDICKRPPKTRKLHVDHNHTTGLIRGLLCYRCNHAIGLLGDDSARAMRMAVYLSKE